MSNKTEIRKEFMGKLRTDYMKGIEIEMTPALSEDTLFVQGLKSFDDINLRAKKHNIGHIYLGANRSFDVEYEWAPLIAILLNNGYKVTLDYPAIHHNTMINVLPNTVWKNNRFIPMLTVDITNICGLSKNLTLKIDDPSAVNIGVWCWNQKDLANDAKLTKWHDYADDENIE